jgi:ureidoacrylate peracid hydrolase
VDELTVRDAMFRDYQCVLLRDCMAEPIGNSLARTNHEASLLSIEVLFGWTASSDDFAKSLRAEAPTDFSVARAVPPAV